MTGKDFAKLAIGFITSASVGAVIKNVVNHTTPYGAGAVNNVLTAIGGIVISTIVGEICTDYIEEKIFPEEKKK